MNLSLSGLVSQYQSLRQNHSESVLATIIETTGSTYRKAVTRILIARQGQLFGVLGGEALRQTSLKEVRQVFISKQNCIIVIDNSYSDEFDIHHELEPNAEIYVLLEYCYQQNNCSILGLIRQSVKERQAMAIATICSSELERCTNQT